VDLPMNLGRFQEGLFFHLEVEVRPLSDDEFRNKELLETGWAQIGVYFSVDLHHYRLLSRLSILSFN